MNVYSGTLLILTLALAGCVTMNDFQQTQDQLKANAGQRKVYASGKEIAKDLGDKCTPPASAKWTLTLTDQDPILAQDDHGTLGYFKVLCFDADGKPHRLKVTGVHAGGGYGKAFFLLPKITLIDANGKSTPGNFLSVKQNAWTGNLEGLVELGTPKQGRHMLILEGDNRTGRNGIGTYVQSTYGGGVFIS